MARAERVPTATKPNRRIALEALKVSLVVGTVLNLINNGEQIWQLAAPDLWPALLNYVVPFCVSGYSAARSEARFGAER